MTQAVAKKGGAINISQGINSQLPAVQNVGTQVFEAMAPVGARGATLELTPSDESIDDAYEFDVVRDGETIGSAALFGIVRHNVNAAWLGLALDQSDSAARAEAFALLLKVGFEELALHRIEILVPADNTELVEQLRGLGVPDEGVARRLLRVDGEYRDQVRFVFDAELWEERGDAMTEQSGA